MKLSHALINIVVLLASYGNLLAAEAAASAFDDLVPQCLLNLLHAPEVHEELQLSDQQVEELERLLRSVDAQWFPSRILPADQQRATVNQLETQVWEWFSRNSTEAQRDRLRQLELYGQGNRMVFRGDIAKTIGLSSPQQSKLAIVVRAADESRVALAAVPQDASQRKSLQQRSDKAAKAEREGFTKLITPEQSQSIKAMLGESFDTTKLKRIYALAPEFMPVEHWCNSSSMTIRELKGKVLLVHFYAFQCHNCHANFAIYRRWQQELTKKGVVVVGIQTPETNRERDVDAVKAAAIERDLKFPIMIDLASENWKAWGNTMWPCVYVVDKKGYIRMWWQGELNWKGAKGDKIIETAVESLLAEK